MEDSLDRRIAEIAERQHGVFTLAQAEGVGFTRAQRLARIRSGRWVLHHERVYRIAGAPMSWKGSLLAACWGARGLAMASHRAAARLRDLPGGREIVEVTCHRWKRAKVDGLVVHETELLDDADVDCVDGIPCASVEQTLLGIAATVQDDVLEMAVDRALDRKLTSIGALEEFVDHKGARGRNGIGRLRSVVEALDPGAGVPQSPMETKLKQLLRRHELPLPEFQYEIWHEGRFVARVDAAYPEHRIAIEYDSYEHHTGRQAIDRDSERRARLSSIRWDTITFTAAAIRRDGGQALRTLRARLGAFGAPTVM